MGRDNHNTFPCRSFRAAALPLAQVFLLSAAVLGFELALMRILLLASWHHFAFLVISVALLGFGTAGTLLYLFRRPLLENGPRSLFLLTAAAACGMALSVWLTQYIPIASRFLPSLIWRQLGGWLLYWLVLLIPFLLGAAGIGLAIMRAGPAIPRIYAANLMGSGLGVILATGGMWILSPTSLAAACGLLAMFSAFCVSGVNLKIRLAIPVASVALISVLFFAVPPRIRTDPYKYQGYLDQLERQGLALRIGGRHTPKGLIGLYRSDLFHDLPFFSGTETPPSMHAITLDGHLAATVLDLSDIGKAGFLRQVLSAAAYELAPARPSVLLLGELGGSNIWLAALHGAPAICVAHEYPETPRMIRDLLPDHGGAVYDLPGVNYVHAYPRHYIQNTRERYDLIHLTAFESMPAGGGGIAGLGQDNLLTVEGIAACLDRLTSQGLLVVSRGIQEPARDNLKIMATFADALRRSGVEEPGRHLVVIRDFLAVSTIAKPTPWEPAQLDQVAALIESRHLTGVWFTGIPERFINRPDVLPGPDGDSRDWFAAAAPVLFSDDADTFIRDWVFDLRPARDYRPFFFDFSRLHALPAFREAFGDLWLTRTELAFPFVLAAAIAIALVALVATLLPLVFVRPGCSPAALFSVVGYFSCLGLAYLILEIAFLSKLIHIIGDPLQSAAVAIATFLVFSGLGSWTAQGITIPKRRFLLLMACLTGLAVGLFLAALPVARAAGGGGQMLRYAAGVALIAPLAFLMGFPMPLGLRRLQSRQDALIAWAWGINGFSSVLAPPIATLIGMVWGFHLAIALAVAIYLASAFFFGRMDRTLGTRADGS